MKTTFFTFTFIASFLVISIAQPEVSPWSNISGIRIDGELMELNTSVGLVGPDWSTQHRTAKERARYQYRREQRTQFSGVEIDSLFWDQSVEDLGGGAANVRIQFRCEKDTQLMGAFFFLSLPYDQYKSGQVQVLNPEPSNIESAIIPDPHVILRGHARGILIKSEARQLEIEINEATEIFVVKDTLNQHKSLDVYFAFMTGQLHKGTSTNKSFHIQTSGSVDRSPIELALDINNLGRPFTGFGGNFRLQNPTTDPPVIDYCLKNMEVRWGRVEMPWRFWHPDEETDPLKNARKNGLHSRVEAAMKMAQRLHQMGMPVILSDWSAPDWAIIGERTFGPQPGDLRGNPLDSSKLDKIYQSIGDYIAYAKKKYKFEFVMFSFNESDLGIYVRQTGAEHAQFIKGLGAHLQKRGLSTKLLLGDTADARGWPFVQAALNDSETHPFIRAVSFHSWRGYTDENLKKWAIAAEKMNVPLLVGEGSMDAGAWRYPDIFSEYTYAMEEINLYVRILKICQPESILQWQLTADYSPLKGGGVFGNNDLPLQPTQRYWNFKQLANVPPGLFALPVVTNKQNVVATALGNGQNNKYVIHLVNNGPTRQAVISGLPEDINWMKVFVTNEQSQNSERRRVRVRNGVAQFMAETNSFITLHSVEGSTNFSGGF